MLKPTCLCKQSQQPLIQPSFASYHLSRREISPIFKFQDSTHYLSSSSTPSLSEVNSHLFTFSSLSYQTHKMRTSSSSTILLLATTLHLVTASPPISIIPVPSYIPTIDILPPVAATGTTAAYVALPLTIVPEPDLLAASSVVVVLPAISTLVPEEEPVKTMSPVAVGVKTSVVVVEEEGWTSTTTVVAASLFSFSFPLSRLVCELH